MQKSILLAAIVLFAFSCESQTDHSSITSHNGVPKGIPIYMSDTTQYIYVDFEYHDSKRATATFFDKLIQDTIIVPMILVHIPQLGEDSVWSIDFENFNYEAIYDSYEAFYNSADSDSLKYTVSPAQ